MSLKPEQQVEIIEVENYDEEEPELLSDDDESDEASDEVSNPYDVYDGIAQLAQLFVTEEGVPVADVLVGIRDALDKLNKIVFKAVQQQKSA
jgi:hypothetical protein